MIEKQMNPCKESFSSTFTHSISILWLLLRDWLMRSYLPNQERLSTSYVSLTWGIHKKADTSWFLWWRHSSTIHHAITHPVNSSLSKNCPSGIVEVTDRGRSGISLQTNRLRTGIHDKYRYFIAIQKARIILKSPITLLIPISDQ